jgi:hypothetical protein
MIWLTISQTAIRKTFLGAMGLATTKELAGYTPLDAGVFWLKDAASGDLVLVPNFGTSWADNHHWVNWMLQFVKANLPNYAMNWTAEMIAEKPLADIKKRIHATFLNFQKRVRDLKRLDRQPILIKNKKYQRKQRVRIEHYDRLHDNTMPTRKPRNANKFEIKQI